MLGLPAAQCLIGEPYQTAQEDFEGVKRKVWIFPLQIEGESAPIPEEVFRRNMEEKERKVRKLSTADLLSRLKPTESVQTRKTTSNQHVRDAIVTELAKRRAKGKCQLCEQDAPFIDRNDEPYLEVHHVKWLSRGGRDSLDNIVALCPNCHRRMHVLDQRKDREYLKKKAQLPVE